MVSPEFVVGGQWVRPFYRAPWADFPSDPMLAHLQGDFPCVPFGIAPASLEEFPQAWRGLDPGHTDHAHGYPANVAWKLAEGAPGTAELRLELPSGEAVGAVRRTVRCQEPWVVIEDELTPRRDARLPLGLHPMLRLPEQSGGARLVLPDAQALLTFPIATDASSLLVPDAEFSDPSRAPLRAGGTLDLTSLPLAPATEELVLLVGVTEPRVALENLVEGYRVILEWEDDHLSHCLLWISNRGRSFPPWDGRNLCIGIEPVTSAFDLGTAVSAAENPLVARGLRTAVDLRAGIATTLRHRFRVEPLS